jgi:hypothetical protein
LIGAGSPAFPFSAFLNHPPSPPLAAGGAGAEALAAVSAHAHVALLERDGGSACGLTS